MALTEEQIQKLVGALQETQEIKKAIIIHLRNQFNVRDGFVKLDTGKIVKEGELE
jgi:hypothetical protein